MKFVFAIIATIFFTANAIEDNRVCVLDYLQTTHPNSKKLDKIFSNAEGVKVFHDPEPRDFKHCIEEGFEEILVFAHSVRRPETGRIKLVYYVPYSLDEKRELIREAIANFGKRIPELKRQLNDLRERNDIFQKGENSDFKNQIHHLEIQIRKSETRLNQLKTQPDRFESMKIYSPFQEFLPNVFRGVRELLASHPARLKKIRFMTCMEKDLLPSYSELKSLSEENKIQLEFAPNHSFWNLLLKQDRTYFSSSWLKKSLTSP